MKTIIACISVFLTVASLHALERLSIIEINLQASDLVNVEQLAGLILTADPITPGEYEVELRGINVWYMVPGIGRSGRSEDTTRYSLAEYVEDLEALRRHLGFYVLIIKHV